MDEQIIFQNSKSIPIELIHLQANYIQLQHLKITKELNSNKHLMSDEQNRMVDRSIRNCVLNGLNLNDAEYKICQELNNKIQEQQNLFK